MAQTSRKQAPQRQQNGEYVQRKPGLLYNLLWGWPWALIGMLLVSLLLSLIIEYIGMFFFWPELGANHSQTVMNTELGYLSSEFRHSLLLSEPSVTIISWINQAYQWAFEDSGFINWLTSTSNRYADNEFSRQLTGWSAWLAGSLNEYLMATVYVTVVIVVRTTILVLSIPLFIMAAVVAFVEGLGRRDLRRYGAAYESSFVYHHAKRLVKPAVGIPCLLYLSWPGAVYPNLLLLPAALLLGVAITVTTASFKKYL